jgi:hypothetical protein
MNLYSWKSVKTWISSLIASLILNSSKLKNTSLRVGYRIPLKEKMSFILFSKKYFINILSFEDEAL